MGTLHALYLVSLPLAGIVACRRIFDPGCMPPFPGQIQVSSPHNSGFGFSTLIHSKQERQQGHDTFPEHPHTRTYTQKQSEALKITH